MKVGYIALILFFFVGLHGMECDDSMAEVHGARLVCRLMSTRLYSLLEYLERNNLDMNPAAELWNKLQAYLEKESDDQDEVVSPGFFNWLQDGVIKLECEAGIDIARDQLPKVRVKKGTFRYVQLRYASTRNR